MTLTINVRALTLCKRTVSDTISSPSRAAFQLSITVLVHYRSVGVFSLATSSWLLPTGFLEPRRTLDLGHTWKEFISSTGLSPSLAELSRSFNYKSLLTCQLLGLLTSYSATPLNATAQARHLHTQPDRSPITKRRLT